MKLDRKDWKYLEANPEGDPNFDPEKNRQIIENTIKETDKTRRQKDREYEENIRERAWAANKYLKHLDKGGEGDAVKFFGNNYSMYLKGRELLERLNAEKKSGHEKKMA